jgi:hypothetical protein
MCYIIAIPYQFNYYWTTDKMTFAADIIQPTGNLHSELAPAGDEQSSGMETLS